MELTTAAKLAYKILKGFERYYRLFSRITSESGYLFEQENWQQLQNNSKKRLTTYDQMVSELVAEVYFDFNQDYKQQDYWQNVKHEFTRLIHLHPQFELAETFFNSVFSRVFKHDDINSQAMYVYASQKHNEGQFLQQVVTYYPIKEKMVDTIDAIFADYLFDIETEDRARDLRRVSKALKHYLGTDVIRNIQSVEMLKPVFYRNKAAYLIGRMNSDEGQIPFVVVLLNENKKLYIDTILLERKDLSSLFSFARSYFFVDTAYPAEITCFLKRLLPNKKMFELYSAIGFHKHCKTDFYRNFLNHLKNSSDLLEPAPGIKGLVMTVFHLPSYGVVFKVIKDKFAPSKPITRQHVKDKYHLIKTHDRVGRMADTHEFTKFRFPRHRFSAELLEELKQTTPSAVEFDGNEIIIKHLYIERKLQPLNLYLAEHADDEDKIDAVMEEYGNAIKEIAAVNIFPGDMLLKNFGVTRRGRVVYYDYDEVKYMTECNFQTLPRTPEGDIDPCLSISPGDIFPEQFATFVLYNPIHRAHFSKYHSNLLEASYWRKLQQEIVSGQMQDVFPYSSNRRFRRDNAL